MEWYLIDSTSKWFTEFNQFALCRIRRFLCRSETQRAQTIPFTDASTAQKPLPKFLRPDEARRSATKMPKATVIRLTRLRKSAPEVNNSGRNASPIQRC